ncbi:hypothetical protein [Bacillus sp. EAC]|uniref:hypothetical protein n=1 Tax=Bacillus sp. EAC TaxID=1978338 RepID=UPI001C4F5345|nr:hypothetical protein [Bacillus sp. EAC]
MSLDWVVRNAVHLLLNYLVFFVIKANEIAAKIEAEAINISITTKLKPPFNLTIKFFNLNIFLTFNPFLFNYLYSR